MENRLRNTPPKKFAWNFISRQLYLVKTAYPFLRWSRQLWILISVFGIDSKLERKVSWSRHQQCVYASHIQLFSLAIWPSPMSFNVVVLNFLFCFITAVSLLTSLKNKSAAGSLRRLRFSFRAKILIYEIFLQLILILLLSITLTTYQAGESWLIALILLSWIAILAIMRSFLPRIRWCSGVPSPAL